MLLFRVEGYGLRSLRLPRIEKPNNIVLVLTLDDLLQEFNLADLVLLADLLPQLDEILVGRLLIRGLVLAAFINLENGTQLD